MARGSDSERDEREAGLGLGVGDVVKAGPPSVRAPEPGPAPAEEGDEFTRLENEHRELLRADEVAEQRQQTLRRHRELDRAARFHLGIKFEDPDPELGSWAPCCTTNLIIEAIDTGHVQWYLDAMPEVETGLEDDDLWLDVEKAIEAAGENDDDDEENRRGGNGPSGD